jgi:UDP-N-acetylglucosamine 2-epimerase
MFYSVLTHFNLLVGNSSAGLVETASFGIPVVNIGDRQKGRPSPANVLHVGGTRAPNPTLAQSINLALNRLSVPVANPYGDGYSAPRIAKIMVEYGTS